MVMIMGTSTCHMVLAARRASPSPASAATSRTASCRASSATRRASRPSAITSPGSSSDAVPTAYRREARERGIDIHALLQERAAAPAAGRIRPARARLVERQSLGARRRRPQRAAGRDDAGDDVPEEIYRALIEATAFGTRVIIETFESNGVPIHDIVACGGLAEKSPLIMQIYADVTGRPFRHQRVGPDAGPRLGDVRGGRRRGRMPAGHATIEDASRAMARLRDDVYEPDPTVTTGLRRAVPRVHAAARLLRTRRERRHAGRSGRCAAGARRQLAGIA